ncbi:MAG: glycosyltransferase family 9 protein, partial [Candidatus Omnitrophica bacterium]|nr:glycosyltransferase family 9 protein [Candidatus Omnitrophota bacterium]
MKILLVTLSNIGDAVLTLPVLDYLKTIYKDARITCICGARPREIFEGDKRLRRVIVYDKKAPLRSKLALLKELRAEKFDAVIDLRNGLFGFLVPARLRIPWSLRVPRGIRHMKDRHLFRARMAFPRQLRAAESGRQSFFIAEDDRRYIRRVLEEAGLAPAEKVIVVACGARSSTKRWGADKFRALCPLLGKARQARIVLVGDEMDSAVAESVAGALGGQVINLCAKTSVRQLAALM